jgi:hypothetical protein
MASPKAFELLLTMAIRPVRSKSLPPGNTGLRMLNSPPPNLLAGEGGWRARRGPPGILRAKAKNLRQRLRSYRVANPERVSRRHLRLLREVARIEFDLCPNEFAALAREAELLRHLKPKFNRAGVWPGKARFLTWRFAGEAAQFSVHEVPPAGWGRFGSLCGYALRLHGALVRLLWLALHPQIGFSRLPHGWAHNRFALPATMACGQRAAEIRLALENLFWGQAEAFSAWVRTCMAVDLPVFEQAAVLADLEEIQSFTGSYRDGRPTNSRQLALL